MVMSDAQGQSFQLPPEQQAIRDKCFHPSGTFTEFKHEEIEQSIPERFEKIVRRHPARLAVKMGDHALTYDELNQAANRIARGILDCRGPKQEPVIVLFEQGVEAIAAILGVLKAGKFYVPVNPSFPNARIGAILDDAQPGLLITDNKNIAVAGNVTKNLLNIDTIKANVSNENLSPLLSPDDLAYIIYTSGSTGKPKGVFQKHRNVLQWTLLHSNTLHICAEDRLSLMHSHSTGGGMLNMYGALLSGAALFPFDFRADGVKLARWLIDERITIYHSGPLVFCQWVDALTGMEVFPELRLIRLSGMPMSAEDLARYRSHFSPDCLLVHVLGTSEAGTIPHYFIDKRSKVSESVPVGYSVGDSKVFVVDESGRRAEPEVVGEIAIRSRYLVCGYWRNTELTNEKFLPDPEGGEERLYLTGDLGRMSADRCLYHLGRKDFKVKIRGYSVEISEIEGPLREHPAIKEVVVVSGADAKGEPQLIAYLVTAIATELTASALRNYLIDKLPEYMVPSIFVTLPALPLTPSGKIDRKALPAPPSARPGLDAAYVAPRTPLELALKKIWSEVLSLDDIGVHDNFFDLGGHSLRAAQVVARIRQLFQVEIALQKMFATPTLAELADYIESEPRSSGRAETFPLERISSDEPQPLSFAQQRLWFLDQLEPASVRYNVVLALLFTGPLGVEILKHCLDEIVRRHESLRTVIAVVDGRPWQKVVPTMTLDLPVVDLGKTVPEAALDSTIRQYIAEATQEPFDLSSGPLIRSSLLSLKPDRYVLLLRLHHIAFDGWSGAIVLREIASLYGDFLQRKSASLPDLPIQYSDYAGWQRRLLQGAVLEDLLAYWKKQLENVSRLQWPTDRPRPTMPSCRGARKFFSLSALTTHSLNALSRQENATLFMLLLAAFQTLLHRYTGQTDIVTGTPVAGRPRAEIENLVGFFLNMLVLRVDLSGNPTFRQILARTRQTCLDAYAHEALPFEMLVEELKPERIINQNPLFQVSFVLQNFPKAPFESLGITAVEMDIDPGIARFDLHVFMTEEENGLKGYFEYNTDLFDATTIELMVGHFQTMLGGIVDNPNQHVSELPVLAQTERRRLLIEWNDTKRDYPSDKCIHELFEEQVERTPNAIALVFEDRQLTYRELNKRANQLAHYLRKLGVGPEVLVGVCVERSIELIIGVLGILKAGGAYVPFDPSYPADRVEFMLRDADVSVLLTQKHLTGQLPACDSAVVYLDAEHLKNSSDDANEADLESSAKPDDLAYVIYTSGSTGKPNGVLITHRSAGAFLNWAHSAFTQEDFAGVIASTSICFDLSVFEIFAPLTAGGQVILVENALALAHVDEAVAPTLVNTVPSVMAELLRLGGLPKSIRTVNLAGEPLKASLVRQIHQQTSAQQVYDLYGPSETTTYSTYTQRTADGTQTIGRPIANTQIYILDPHGNPAPIGIPGEIYIGGAGLARGYLNRPELTAEKFIANPFSTERGARLYRTGDSARYLPDGNIEFLGRLDNQVKIRGFRIELGEIEAVLGQHPMVQSSVVVVREDTPGDKRLVGYLVARPEETFDAFEVRQYLKHKLPEYMIPAIWVLLDELPLTPSGKVDRRALPAPDQNGLQLANVYQPPRTPTEQTLVAIWDEVLKLEKVGIHDNFFDLGGHSLLATQVMSRIRSAFSIDLPLRRMFESPTVAEIAVIVTESRAQPVSEAALARMLSEVEVTTEEEAQKILAK